MPNKDSPTLREEFRRLSNGLDKDHLQAEEESKAAPISRPGGFRNDPDDPTNPNEVRERYLAKLRALTLRPH